LIRGPRPFFVRSRLGAEKRPLAFARGQDHEPSNYGRHQANGRRQLAVQENIRQPGARRRGEGRDAAGADRLFVSFGSPRVEPPS
jgi:hypothetical protein